MGKYSFMFYYDWEPYLKMLPDDAARGRMIMALLAYASQGEELASDDPVEQLLFAFCKNAIDRDKQKYMERCMQNAENANKRWEKHKNANAYERKRTHATDADMDMDMDMEKDIDRISPSRTLKEPVGEAKDGSQAEARRELGKVIYTR